MEEVKQIVDEVKTQGSQALSQEAVQISETEILKEMSDREKRKNNAVFFRAPEVQTNLKQERIDNDTKLVKEVGKLVKVTISDDDITKVVRLGKRPEEGENTHSNNRPMLVSFSNEHIKKTLFKNLSKLKDATGELGEVSVDHDMTPKEREELKALKAQAKEKEELSSGKYRYRVRGPTWDRYIKRLPVLGME